MRCSDEATWGMPIRYCGRYFLKKGGQTPVQFAERSCRSSVPGNSQNSAGFNPAHNLTSKLVLHSAEYLNSKGLFLLKLFKL